MKKDSTRRRGSALLIVLAMMVLLAALVVAFFSRSLLEQQISASSANQIKIELFTNGVLAAVQAELKQEIVESSTLSAPIVSGSVSTVLYQPKSFAAMLPSRESLAGLSVSGTMLPNLVKMSSPHPMYAGGAARASDLLSTSASRNGRAVSLARWNLPLLLPKEQPDEMDCTPKELAEERGKAPHWIMVTRSGEHPQTWNAEVVGRYAFMIYNTGGLLDANVAGRPTVSGTLRKLWNRKGSAAFADLTQLPGLNGLNDTRAQEVVNQLVGWRNSASARAAGDFPNLTVSGGDYLNYLLNQAPYARFMTVSGALGGSGQSDRMFSSRRQLIRFLTQGVAADDGERVKLQQTLQYLSTFNRSLNQPSYWPDPQRPKVFAPGGTDNITGSQGAEMRYPGGNDAFNRDDQFNPAYPLVRVTNSDANNRRNDGSLLLAGEPLVKKRFALERLLWLTYKGPSARLAPNDAEPLYRKYKELMPEAALRRLWMQGTEENILRYFGLVWRDADDGTQTGIGGYWLYQHGADGNGIRLLEQVNAANREPNFFELLKSSVSVGAIARYYPVTGWPAEWQVGRYERYIGSRIDYQIFQLAANIIDQAGPDNYPTQIVFSDRGDNRSFWGVVDLPYLYGLTNVGVLAKPSLTREGEGTKTSKPVVPPPTLLQSGTVVALQIPVIWNPHRANSEEGELNPAELRIGISNFSAVNDQSQQAGKSSRLEVWARYAANDIEFNSNSVYADQADDLNIKRKIAPWSVGTRAKAGYLKLPDHGAAGNTAIYFNNSGTALYREPTPLLSPQRLGGAANLHVDDGSVMRQTNSAWKSGVTESDTGETFVGFFMGAFDQRWRGTIRNSNTTALFTTNVITAWTYHTDVNTGFTVSLEYNIGGNRWVPYHQTRDVQTGVPFGVAYNHDDTSPNGNPYHQRVWHCWAKDRGGKNADGDPEEFRHRAGIAQDPRSSRGGNFMVNGKMGEFVNSGPAIYTYRRDTGLGDEAWGIRPGGLSQCSYVQLKCSGDDDRWVNNEGYVVDPDGVIRPGVGAYVPANNDQDHTAQTINGLPLSLEEASRPVILHRPFRTVSELGCAFTDSPWRNIDFSTPASGYAALLDVFCINDDSRSDAVEAGKVDLNTRQAPVIKALLAGAYRDEFDADNELTARQSETLADKLVARTIGDTAANGPLRNVAELLGRWIPGSRPNGTVSGVADSGNLGTSKTRDTYNWRECYTGFSLDTEDSTQSSAAIANVVPRYRESAVRALADSGQTGVWNLLVDVVVQTGRYPVVATSGNDFVVEGERRCWMHVAIDRVTGRIIDRQIEVVEE